MLLNLTKALKAAAAAALLFSATAANAALLQFNLTGSYTASWQLNSNPTPDDYLTGTGVAFIDVEGSFPGAILGVADLIFYSALQGGGLEIYDYYNDVNLLLTDGPQLYSGTEGAPVFNAGTFSLTDFSGSGTYTLTVTNLDAGPGPTNPGEVPEPATAAMLLGGLGLMYASRKRRFGK